MDYKEFCKIRNDEYNKLPIFYAFSNEQFEKAMNERGLTIDQTDMIYKLGNTGGFYLKKDSDKIHEYFRKDWTKQLHDHMENDHDFAQEAIRYEMSNHEYPINWEGDYDVCSCFGSIEWSEDKTYREYLDELGFSDDIKRIFREEQKRIEIIAERW